MSLKLILLAKISQHVEKKWSHDLNIVRKLIWVLLGGTREEVCLFRLAYTRTPLLPWLVAQQRSVDPEQFSGLFSRAFISLTHQPSRRAKFILFPFSLSSFAMKCPYLRCPLTLAALEAAVSTHLVLCLGDSTLPQKNH